MFYGSRSNVCERMLWGHRFRQIQSGTPYPCRSSQRVAGFAWAGAGSHRKDATSQQLDLQSPVGGEFNAADCIAAAEPDGFDTWNI